MMHMNVIVCFFATRCTHSVSQRRFQSTAAATFVTQKKAAGTTEAFRRNWLGDSATYPLIAIMGCAGALVVGVGTSCLLYNPDVQINPNRRGSTIRSW
jgi:hypothetical protein